MTGRGLATLALAAVGAAVAAPLLAAWFDDVRTARRVWRAFRQREREMENRAWKERKERR